jgi:hypothetical protein
MYLSVPSQHEEVQVPHQIGTEATAWLSGEYLTPGTPVDDPVELAKGNRRWEHCSVDEIQLQEFKPISALQAYTLQSVSL